MMKTYEDLEGRILPSNIFHCTSFSEKKSHLHMTQEEIIFKRLLLGLIFEDFLTLGMKKFPYLTTGPFGNPIFLWYAFPLHT